MLALSRGNSSGWGTTLKGFIVRVLTCLSVLPTVNSINFLRSISQSAYQYMTFNFHAVK